MSYQRIYRELSRKLDALTKTVHAMNVYYPKIESRIVLVEKEVEKLRKKDVESRKREAMTRRNVYYESLQKAEY